MNAPLPDKLNSADRRFLLVSVLLLALTVWFSAVFFHRAFPEASIDFRVTRADSREIAQHFLKAEGLSTDAYREASRFSFDDTAKTFLEREVGLDRANNLMGTRVRVWRWAWRWFRPLEKEEYRASVTPRGEVAGFEHILPEAAPRPSLAPDQARARAEAFLREKMHRDLAALEFVEGSSLVRPARTDHVFTWKERDFNLRDASYRLEVTILGNETGGYHEYLKVPENWQRDYERLRSRNLAAQSIDTAVMMFLVVGLLVVIVIKVRNQDVHWRVASVVGIIGAVLLFLSSLNSHPLEMYAYPTTDSYGSFLARHLLQYVLQALAAGGLLFALTAGAEPLYRQYFGTRIALGNLFRPRAIGTRSFLKGAVLGLALTGIFVAYQTAFYLVAYKFGAWSPADVPYDELLNTRFPWLFVLFGGFLPAVSEEFLFRMFAIPWLRKVVRSTWAALILAGFIWGFGHAGYPQQPFWIRGVEVGIGGVALGLVMLRWGILPTLVWHYSVDALYTALLLLRSHNLYFALSGAASAGIMLLPVLAAGVLYLRRGGFEPETGLTNADVGAASPPEKHAAAPESVEEEPAYRASGLRRRLVVIAIIAGASAVPLGRIERFGNQPEFAIAAPEAQRAADAFLKERNLDLAKFRAAQFAGSRWEEDGGGFWQPQETAKYFLERRPVSFLIAAYRDIVPMQIWSVRYFRPLDQEEVQLSVNPKTRAVSGFRHTLPEDRPGADIDSQAARRIAEDFLAGRGFDMATLELKETSSDRKKARRDHTLVWEARPGDPRNLEEARYRVRVEVAGDQVSLFTSFWKLPETYVRERARANALSVGLLVVRIALWAGLVVAGILLLIGFTRHHEMRWKPALALAGVATAVALAGTLSNLPLMMRAYSTAIPLETFRAVSATSVVIGAVGWFLAFACCFALLLGLRPGALAALAARRRRAAALDALAVAVAGGLVGMALGNLGAFLRNHFHAQAIFSPSGVSHLGAAVPALSLFSGGVAQVIYGLTLAAVLAYLVKLPRRRSLAIPLALIALCGLLPADVHTGGEFLLAYGIQLLSTAVAVLFLWRFAGSNDLAWLATFWTLILGERAAGLLEQPAATFQWQGWALAAVVALGLIWAVLPALGKTAQPQ